MSSDCKHSIGTQQDADCLHLQITNVVARKGNGDVGPSVLQCVLVAMGAGQYGTVMGSSFCVGGRDSDVWGYGSSKRTTW